MALLNESEQRQVAAAINAVERETDAELVTVLAARADDYTYIPLLWASVLALLVPGALNYFGGWLSAQELLLVQWLSFAGLSLLLRIPALTSRLIPRAVRHWRASRPDAIYVATEGPLGWSALRAARRLGIPAATGFHTRFDEYMRDYGVGFLEGVALGWMRRFHNAANATLVPTRELAGFLGHHAQHLRLPPAGMACRHFQHDAKGRHIGVLPGLATEEARQHVGGAEQEECEPRQAAHGRLGDDGGGRLVHCGEYTRRPRQRDGKEECARQAKKKQPGNQLLFLSRTQRPAGR